MPPDLVNAFTANGAIETAEFFVDDTIGGKGSHYQYPTDVSSLPPPRLGSHSDAVLFRLRASHSLHCTHPHPSQPLCSTHKWGEIAGVW
jgi:hypothetical protein